MYTKGQAKKEYKKMLKRLGVVKVLKDGSFLCVYKLNN
jgi:hypothetical protein